MQPQPARVWHNIRPNEITRIPRQHIVLSVATRSARRGRTGIQTWRLAVANFIQGAKGRSTRSETSDFKDAKRLWRDVSRFVGDSGRCILWSHKLDDTVRITQVFHELPAQGWNLTGHNITNRASWLEWKRGKATLLMLDTLAFFPTTIDQIGIWHGQGVRAVGIDSDDDLDWLASCRRHNGILSKAISEYLAWLEREDMGNFQITGAAQSWATYRHKFLTHKLTVHNEPDALTAERRAMWTGRCEAYWRGELKGERVYEFDFAGAYPRIARDYSVPTKLIGDMPPTYDWHNAIGNKRTALLAEITVNTRVPVLPASYNGRILWPIGTFNTTVWDVEIQAALAAGASVTVNRAWLYRKAPALQAWGTWIMDQLSKDDTELEAWQRAILKHWSRALIGRFAMTYNLWDDWGTAPTSTVKRSILYDAQTKTKSELMQVGTTVWEDKGRTDWQNSMPMITGYVQAIGRVHLWEVLQQLGERRALYVDTDSILTTSKYLGDLQAVTERFDKGVLRLKRAWDGFAIYGPRQVVTGTQVRVSGIPRNAEQISGTHYKGEVRDSLRNSLRNGAFDRVITRDREWRVSGVDNRRMGTGFGWTQPIDLDALREAERDGTAGAPLGNAP